MIGYIYIRTNTINNKSYIGQTTNYKKRNSEFNNISQSYAGAKIDNARKKYGVDCFDCKILVEIEDDDKTTFQSVMDYFEKVYIAEYNTFQQGYNLTMGGGGNSGYKHSDSAKEKNRIAHLKENLSADTIKKMSDAKKNKSKEQIDKLSKLNKNNKYMLGHKHTDDAKRRMSENHKGVNSGSTAPWARKIVMLNANNEFEEKFDSIVDAKNKYGFNQRAISRSCRKGYKCSGHKFMYLEDYLNKTQSDI